MNEPGTKDRLRALAVPAVTLLFFASGGCGLLYQVVWTRKLVLLFGTTAYAVGTVLFIFFLGLGLGSLWGGRLADRSKNPLRLFGLFEIGIGLWAVAFILLVGIGEDLAITLLRSVAAWRPGAIALRAALALVLLLPPVTLMGATLPLLSAFVVRTPRMAGFRVGALYTLNTLGAAAGCLVAGFWLLERLGYTGTTLVGAAVNVAVGLAAMALARGGGGRDGLNGRDGLSGLDAAAPARPDGAEDPVPVWTVRLVALTLFAEGFCTLAAEVVWIRLLAIVFTGTTHAFTTMLVTLLAGMAAGSALATLLADRIRNRLAWFALAEILGGLAVMATALLFQRVPQWYADWSFDTGGDWSAMVGVKFWVSFATLLAPMFFLGMTYPLAVRAVTAAPGRVGRRVGWLYCANTLGGVAGAVAGGFVVIPLLGAGLGIVALGGVLALVALLPLARAFRPALALPVAGAAVLAMAALVFQWRALPNVVETLTIADIPPDNTLLHFDEGVEATVAVSQQEEEDGSQTDRVLWINGVQATAAIEKGVRMNRFQGALPLLFDRPMKRGLLMCFGSGITCGTLAAAGFEHIDAVEIAPNVLDAAPWFDTDNLGVMNRPNVRFIIDDGRNHLLTTRETYDLITFEPMPLALAGVSAFYTREYYELCLRRLNPGGLVSQWVPLHSLNPDIVRSLVRTFASVFPECSAWFINADLFLIGSDRPLALDFAAASERLARPGLAEALAAADLEDPVELFSAFMLDKEAVARFAGEGPVMTDDRPWAEFEAPRLMNVRKVQDSLRLLQEVHQSPLALVPDPAALPEGVAAALDRRYAARKRGLDGLALYYGGTAMSNTEDPFLEAIAIDPGDRMALYYLRQLANTRTELFVRWQQFDEADEYFDRLIGAMPGEPLFTRLRDTVTQARAEAGEAD
jgi:spermidine synthase